jgi:DNA end-binding protein Ku
MAARSIASLTLGFGLVSIPVKLYTATEASGGPISFNLLHGCGSRVKQQYVCVAENKPVERSELVKGYEFEKDRYVTFEPAELKALEEGARHTIDIVAFVPLASVDPIYYDKAYYLAPDKRGGKPYWLLMEAMRQSGRCALATWAWKGRQYAVQVRPSDEGLVLQQLLYASEVRSAAELGIEHVDVQKSELQLALQLIEQISADTYDPTQFKDEEKERVLSAIDQKIAGRKIVQVEQPEESGGAEVIDLMAALRQSLGRPKAPRAPAKVEEAPAAEAVARKRAGPTRAGGKAAPAAAAAPAEAPKRVARAGRR